MRLAPTLPLLALLLACDAGDADTGGEAATLARVQEEVFDASCAFSTCHGASSPAGGLDLRPGSAHASLVDAPASTGDTLVVPGDPDASYLAVKCTPGSMVEGDPMPVGQDGLDADRLALLRGWIEAGAEE